MGTHPIFESDFDCLTDRMVRGLKVTASFKLEAVTAPGTTLPTPGRVFVEVELFSKWIRSASVYPLFPLLLHERLSVSKIFPKLTDPGRLAEQLSGQLVTVRLMQETAFGDQVLASYSETARSFLFPTPKLSAGYPGVDREVILSRTSHYGGLLEPKLEFSTKTTIKEITARLRTAPTPEKTETKVEKSAIKPSGGTFRGMHTMSSTDPRWTHITEGNKQRAQQSQRRARSPRRSCRDPTYMDSTISFRAKSPDRRKQKKKIKPFLTGTDEHNMVNYARDYTKAEEAEDIALKEQISSDLTTYEQIRDRITRLLETPRAKEINRDGELTSALARIEGKIAASSKAYSYY